LQQKNLQAQIPNARATLQSLTGYIQQTTTTTTTKLTTSYYRNAACKKTKFWVWTAPTNETETKFLMSFSSTESSSAAAAAAAAAELLRLQKTRVLESLLCFARWLAFWLQRLTSSYTNVKEKCIS
jgi:hypothetical protein